MAELNAVIAVFDDHQAAEVAVKKLADAEIDIKKLSVVGKGFHTDEHVVDLITQAIELNSGASAAPSGAAFGGGCSAGFSCLSRSSATS